MMKKGGVVVIINFKLHHTTNVFTNKTSPQKEQKIAPGRLFR